MKKYIFIAALLVGLFSTNFSSAQVYVNKNISIQPAWGPSGYNYARYYFMPEINVYYDITSGLYIYMSGNNWVKRHSMPARYRNYDLYRSYKVVINDKNPWRRHSQYHKQYGRYASMHDKQVPLRDSRDHNNGHNDNGLKNGNRNHSNNGNHYGNNQNNSYNNRNHGEDYHRSNGHQKE